MSLTQILQTKMTEKFSPIHLQIINESHLHNVPQGSESHFKLVIVSEMFSEKNRVARHQLVHELLAPELKNKIHALSLQLFTPKEWQDNNQSFAKSPPCLGGNNS